MSANDEKVREMLNKEPVPQELEPEKIKIMLDEKAPAKKRRNIKKTAARITAGAAACAVICGTSVYFAGQKDLFNNKLVGNRDSLKRREILGNILGIGTANGKKFLSRLNSFNISREVFLSSLKKLEELIDDEC